ncbi:MAG: TonB-dependent receptor, partial [FCB group bacterium]|nr:TonB-dependent receptor [FCB group bacterium]
MTACVSAGTTGRIAGVVTDSEGEPLVGASVMIVGTSHGSMTDTRGEYLIHNLQAGEYSLQAQMIGHADRIVQGAVVITDMTTRIDFQLNSEAVGTTVINVSDQRGMIVFDETSTVHVIGREEIETMPVATLQDLTQLQAGALYAGGGIHMRGGRAGEIVYLVDGIPIMDPSSNLFTFNIPMSAISEITVMSGGFTAEYGNAQSGVVNIITRTGGDSYTGNINTHLGDYSVVGTEQTNLTNYTQWEDQLFRGNALGGEFAVGGPEPITTYLLPALGIDIPGNIGLFSTLDIANYGHDRLDSRGNWDNNWEDGISATLKLNYIPSPGTRIMTSGYYENSNSGWRDWTWSRINEDNVDDGDTLNYAKDESLALPTRLNENHSISFSLTQTLSDMMFVEMKYNHYQIDEKYRIEAEDGGWIGDGFS